MADLLLLQEIIDNAIGEYCAQNGGGFPVAYAVIVDMVNDDGAPQMVVTTPPDQPTYRSMGLAAYAGAWFADDAQRLWSTICDNDSDYED